jgi:hypothetical protein
MHVVLVNRLQHQAKAVNKTNIPEYNYDVKWGQCGACCTPQSKELGMSTNIHVTIVTSSYLSLSMFELHVK